MGKGSFLKNLFIADDENDNNKNSDSKPTNTESKSDNTTFDFPDSPSKSSASSTYVPSNVDNTNFEMPPTTSPRAVSGVNKFLEKMVEKYQQAFDSFNEAGNDFYEFFNAVRETKDNQASYKMVFNVFKTIDKNYSKEDALKYSDTYIQRINQAHSDTKESGLAKHNELQKSKIDESNTLSSSISDLKQQIASLQATLAEKTTELNTIDSKYQILLDDVDEKLEANEIAKNNILDDINTVVNNIKAQL